MKTYITFSFFIFLISPISFGQNMTYLGVEGAIANDKYEIIDPCGTITSTKILNGSWGFSVGQQIHKNLIFESGVIWKNYNVGYEYIKEVSPYGSFPSIGTGYQTMQVPLRLIARINLMKNKMFLTSTVGYHIGINRDYGYDFDGPSQVPITGIDYLVFGVYTVEIPTTEKSGSLRKTFGLIEAGIGLEYALGNRFIVALSASYFAGLTNVYQETMSTGFTNGTSSCTSNSTVGLSQGSYSNIRLSFKYVISTLWRREEDGL